MQDYQIRSKIHPKQHVFIAVKGEDGEYLDDLHECIVEEVLTEHEEHYRGIKIRATDGTVGRVRMIIKPQKKKK